MAYFGASTLRIALAPTASSLNPATAALADASATAQEIANSCVLWLCIRGRLLRGHALNDKGKRQVFPGVQLQGSRKYPVVLSILRKCGR